MPAPTSAVVQLIDYKTLSLSPLSLVRFLFWFSLWTLFATRREARIFTIWTTGSVEPFGGNIIQHEITVPYRGSRFRFFFQLYRQPFATSSEIRLAFLQSYVVLTRTKYARGTFFCSRPTQKKRIQYWIRPSVCHTFSLFDLVMQSYHIPVRTKEGGKSLFLHRRREVPRIGSFVSSSPNRSRRSSDPRPPTSLKTFRRRELCDTIASLW